MRFLTIGVVVLVLCAWPQTAVAASTDGTSKNDVLRGTRQADVLRGRVGNDVLLGRQGRDRLYGGPGNDTVRGGQGPDSLFGGPGRDRLLGGPGNDVLRGAAGQDRLSGGAGNDRLYGGPGNDRISCGPGKDIVVATAGDRLADDCENKPKASSDDGWSSLEILLLVGLLGGLVISLVLAVAQVLKIRRKPRTDQPTTEGQPIPLWAWLPYSLPFVAVGLLAAAAYTLNVSDVSALAVASLLAAGAFLVGGLFGFLFGIPKSLTGDRPRRFNPNTNLEEISDWLTKIIVGLSLIQLGLLLDRLKEFAEFVKPALGGEPSAPAFAIAVLVLFSVDGFLTLYFATRLYVGEAFARAEGLQEAKGLVQLARVRPRVDAFKESSRSLT